MYRSLAYAFFFVLIVALQVFLLGNLNLSLYIYPLAYIAFVILLPMETRPIVTLLLGLLLGMTMDFLTAEAGLNTIATLFVAFSRKFLLNAVLGGDVVKDGGEPTSRRIGFGKFMRYCSLMVFMHCFIFFTFESLTWSFYYLTLLRVVLSSIVTIILVYFSQMLLMTGHSGYSKL